MKIIKQILIYITVGALFIASGVMGIFASGGICAAIWGGEILETALGSPPDHSHPAFILFMLTMVPFMFIGFTGGFFLFMVPILSYSGIGLGSNQTDKNICTFYIKHLQKINKKSS